MRFAPLIALVVLVLSGIAHAAAPREQTLISDAGWQIISSNKSLPAIDSPEFQSAQWQSVTLPHTFNSRANRSDVTLAWYRRDLEIGTELAGKRLYLIFEGVGTYAEVYVNGKSVGNHRGAYTRFVLDATEALHAGKNELSVRVDNTLDAMKDALPNGSRLYTVWGGLYRKVWLLAVDPVHIDPTYYGSPGVFITPKNISADSADVHVEVHLRNTGAHEQTVALRANLFDAAGTSVASIAESSTIPLGSAKTESLELTVSKPVLWSPLSPNLYYVSVDVLDANQKIIDSVTEPTGFRTLEFKNGLVYLNGQKIVLAGADIHQEIESKAAAMSDDDFRKTFDAVQDLGFNWIRLPHYPHARFEYDMCDKLGILCWAENGHTNKDNISENTKTLTTEMVMQNFNHPSIAVWSVGNEASQDAAEAFAPIVKQLDPSRPVVVANMKATNVDFHGANTYDGWYNRKDMWAFPAVAYITETGGGGVTTTHTDYDAATHNVNKFEPEEYQQLFAESHLQLAFRNNEKLGMFTWWTMRDFNDKKYKNPGVNTKGLLTYAGDKKDVYYLFRAFLHPQVPTVHITSKRYFIRTGAADNGIKAYSNAAHLMLTLNGEKVSTLDNGQYVQPPTTALTTTQAATQPKSTTRHPVDNVFYWPVKLATGKNLVQVADDAGNTDTATIYFYGQGGAAEIVPQNPLLHDLKTSNAANAAYYMDMPVQPQWPIYHDLDSTADNSFAELPSEIEGATWIALKRVTKKDQQTDLTFTLTRPATVFVVSTRTAAAPKFLGSKFAPVTTKNLVWRDNDLYLVPAELHSYRASAGETIHLDAFDRDAIVLLKE